MNFTMRQLEQFVVLAEVQHFGRAAERLNMQQPPLSQTMQKLERTIGVALIDRTTRSFSITPAGESFAADAERILASAGAAVGRARRIAAGKEGVLRVGAVSGLTFDFIPRVVAALNAAYPELEIDLSLASSSALVEAVERGELDVALVRGIRDLPSDIEATVLFEERFVAALHAGHPLDRSAELTMADLAGERFVMPSSTALRFFDGLATAACRAAGFEPTVSARSDSVSGLLSLVAGGIGVTLVSESVAHRTHADVVFVPLRVPDALLRADVRVIRRRRRDDRSARLFVDIAIETAKATDTADDNSGAECSDGLSGTLTG